MGDKKTQSLYGTRVSSANYQGSKISEKPFQGRKHSGAIKGLTVSANGKRENTKTGEEMKLLANFRWIQRDNAF